MSTRARVRHERGILDTSTVILLSQIVDDSLLPAEPLITTVTLAELSVGPLVATTDEERAARQSHVQQAESDFDPLPFDVAAARAFGRVALALRRSGRSVKPRAYDVMIAATALANGLPRINLQPEGLQGHRGTDGRRGSGTGSPRPPSQRKSRVQSRS
ncbi:MAG: type II toxin-antitoxin system VapC family toxin [Vicinamibacterales bacterium]